MAGHIHGYTSATSASPGESLDFHISVRPAGKYNVSIYRLGHYGGAGARRMTISPQLDGTPRPTPKPAPGSRVIACKWPASWTFEIPEQWISGLYLAVFTSADGRRSYSPFVVRDLKRSSDILMVAPFTTYQAYNMWPRDGHTGKNLYRGYTSNGKTGGNPERSFEVSFDRPYSNLGLPTVFEMDSSFTQWAEQEGYDITYATSVDLHEGRIDPSRHSVIVFPGHDEYWSKEMRDHTEEALRAGTHLAFLGANNIYFNVRLEPSTQGRASRVVACYKEDPDPNPGPGGPTIRWRHLDKDHSRAEQGLLGVQYNGMLKEPAPLVVRESGHWLWEGTGLRDGDKIPGLVAIEADGFDRKMPKPTDADQTLLSHSPYEDSMGRGKRIQNTSLCVNRRGTVVFSAGTFQWPIALAKPGQIDQRIQTATTNLFTHLLKPRG
ncbi:N,N-dimethylformamidase beta subunit family domain-containing protein [Streptomyces sp. TRM49041]|uniref:N,N-dimethylformamidase beta subunit family domain-containing protein n=1 Tax=Streptomyces sp. TRM49041 TaxID=2603216 RepID=UPI0021CC6CDF|nr:N,N-dimethylformamidase beta subunit family domain-containing protein [Streptomyces sp. TRM49041]